MAFRYIRKFGDVIEADTVREFEELMDLLNLEPHLELQQSSITDLVSQPQVQETMAPDPALEVGEVANVVNNNESSAISFTGSKVPSVDDFCHLWNKIKRETYREVLRILAKKGYNELSVSELEQRIGQGCKGAMNGIGRLFYGITGLTWKDYVVLNNSKRTYEVNKIAHQNLVSALEILEPKAQN